MEVFEARPSYALFSILTIHTLTENLLLGWSFTKPLFFSLCLSLLLLLLVDSVRSFLALIFGPQIVLHALIRLRESSIKGQVMGFKFIFKVLNLKGQNERCCIYLGSVSLNAILFVAFIWGKGKSWESSLSS